MGEPPTPASDDTLAADSTLPASRARADLPARVGRFVLTRELGRGGMGVVWAAYDPELDRRVAIKFVHRDPGEIGARAEARFLREARSLARLNHLNVAQIYDVGVQDGRVWLAMEFVEGQSFAALMHRRERWVLWLPRMIAAGRGLAAAHAAGLVHRDFKPGNVMLARDGRVVVLDFGLALARDRELERVTDAALPQVSATAPAPALAAATVDDAAIVGTPAYMAPEQFHHGHVDARADQFAFAVTLFEALYRMPPFARGEVPEIVAAITSGPVRARPSRTDVPLALDRVLRRALARDPSQRYPSMDALLDALERFTPASRRRRAGAIAAGGAMVVGAALVLMRPQLPDPCESRAAAVRASWNQAARTQVGGALRGAGLDDDGLATILATLDDRAEALRQAVGPACEAARAAEGAAVVAGPRLRCVDRAAAQLQHTVLRLQHAEDRIAREAVAATHHLPSADRCAEQTAPALDDTALRERIDADGRLASIQTRQRFGELQQALREAEALSDEIEREPESVLHAEVDSVLGDVLESLGRPEQARAVALRGLLRAQTWGDDALVGRLAADLAWIDAERLGRLESAELWAQLGLASLRRAGGDVGAELRLHGALASVRQLQLRFDDAIEEQQRALDLATQTWGADDRTTVAPRLNLANVQWYSGRWSEARDNFERTVELATRIHGPDHALTLGALTSLAGLYNAVGARDEVEAIASDLLARQERSVGPDHPDLVGILVTLAHLADADGAHARAAESLRRALAVLERGGEQGLRPVVVETYLAAMTHRAGDREGARRHLAHAREHASGPAAVELAMVEIQLTWADEGAAAAAALAATVAPQLAADELSFRSELAQLELARGNASAATALLPELLAQAEQERRGGSPGRALEACAEVLTLAHALDRRDDAGVCTEVLLASRAQPMYLRRGVRLALLDRALSARAAGRQAEAVALLREAAAPRPAAFPDASLRAQVQLELARTLDRDHAAEAAAALHAARGVFAVQGQRTAAQLRETDARLAELAR
ncbi:MAG: serine/threonine-protein kinase [Nannocystaceae bacterium]|nr:serine/threonine-protein kinase [Nannocystaceae bacterium]